MTLIDTLRLRARLNTMIRRFFADRGVLEVETPSSPPPEIPSQTSTASPPALLGIVMPEQHNVGCVLRRNTP